MRFNDKPYVSLAITAPFGHEAAANNLADHLEEQLDRQGVIARLSVELIDTSDYSVEIDECDLEVYEDVLDLIDKLRSTQEQGNLDSVFMIDNPEHALYNELYAPVTSVAQAYEDMLDRENLYNAY